MDTGVGHLGRTVDTAALSQLWPRYIAAYNAGQYEAALEIATQAVAIQPRNPAILSNLAVCHLRLDHFDQAIDFAHRSIAVAPDNFIAFDALSHALGEKGDYEAVRRWGLKALELRDEIFTREPDIDCGTAPLPPPPSDDTRARNIIAFSLFGNRSRYCETAVLNAKARAKVYPHWTCLFYVNETVPPDIIGRLRAEGAEIRFVDGPLRSWPGTMWRFAACDIPGVHRVLFRDADSLISARERVLVDDWIASGTRFHHIRDWHTHTELLHAGLWGMTGGALPPLAPMVAHYLQKPLASAHFADQYFLRQHVWLYARKSLRNHDSMFGFLDGKPHPAGRAAGEAHIGANVANGGFIQPAPVPDGTTIVWELQERIKAPKGAPDARCVCRYPCVVKDGKVIDYLPQPYLKRLGKDMRVVLLPPPGWT